MKSPIPYLLSAAALMLLSCEKETTTDNPSNNLPETYNFENVDYSGQTTRLNMLTEVVAYMKTANGGATVSADQLQNMYTNSFTWQNTSLNGSNKQLANKIADGESPFFGALFTSLENSSKSKNTGSNGTAGLVTSNTGTATYLFDENGIEPLQLIEKGTMGALIMYQINEVYLGADKMNVDNETVEPGKGTEMQHHWDEAYGYLGLPMGFGTSGFTYEKGSEYDRFWAKYINGRDALINCNTPLIKAFIKGRDAINNKEYTTRDEAISEIRALLSQVAAATTIHYYNSALANLSDDAIRNHALSEAIAFIYGLHFNPASKVSGTEIDATIQKLSNLYTISSATIVQERDALAAAYGWTNIKESL